MHAAPTDWTTPPYRGVRSSYDDTYLPPGDVAENFGLSYRNKYDAYSPNTKRKMITKLERRLGDLRENSESMALKLGRAEKTLRGLKLDDGGVQQTTGLFDDVMSEDSLLYDDVAVGRRHHRHDDNLDLDLDRGQRQHHRHRHDDRDALRREIARLREDLRLLRRQTTATSGGRDVIGYVTDDDATLRRGRAIRDDYDYNYDYGESRYRNQHGGYDTPIDDDLLRMRRSRTTFDDLNYGRHRVDAPFMTSSTCCSGTGLRSSLTRPLVTQHNKNDYMMTSPIYNRRWIDGFDTTSMRTFKPYSPSDLSIGNVVKFRRAGGRMERGRVMYIGHLPGKSEAFLGIELENNTGNHDGLHTGFRYFQCKPNRGLFVPFDHVVVAWGGRSI